MLRTGFAMLAQTLGAVAPGAVFEADHLPVAGQALVTAHARASAEAQQPCNRHNSCPFAIHVTPRKYLIRNKKLITL
jgi:hypothetical protein